MSSFLHGNVLAKDRELERLCMSESDTLAVTQDLMAQLRSEAGLRARLQSHCDELQHKWVVTFDPHAAQTNRQTQYRVCLLLVTPHRMVMHYSVTGLWVYVVMVDVGGGSRGLR